MVRLRIARRGRRVLCLEAFALVDGVVEFGVGVAHLPAVHEQLKALDIVGLVGLALGEGRYLHGVVHDEGGLDQLVLAELLEEQVEYIALLVAGLVLDIMLIGYLLRRLGVRYLIKVDAGIFLHGLDHGEALKGLAEVKELVPVGDGSRAADSLREIAEHVLGQVHHAVVVGVCLVQLHERELGVMAGVKPLVAKYPANLVDLLKPADDKAL